MMATIKSHRPTREQFEQDAVPMLCSDLIEPDNREKLAGLLKNYAFADQLNEAVYEAILGVGKVPARRLRELLPGRVTNLGFPDFELKEYLGQSGATDDIDTLFEHLLELMGGYPEGDRKAMGQ